MATRSAAALLLQLLAVLTVCQSVQPERSRQRSGPIRSVPVAADVKRDNDFDCPEEFGYYPHPTDCSQYYVCVFGGALLESCTGGLMYSHELQTCDWPRNVGCDATGAGVDIERTLEREPAPPAPSPAPRRTPPPAPPRVQPNPVVTSRGQPKITREQYETVKQQQLYEEIDDLPPVEELESDRQQRVYRGQPSTIGQVQRDRDGYAQIPNGRTLNSNIIPASIQQTSGKIGSFSFGTQAEDRRQTVGTQQPQTYSVDETDSSDFYNEKDLTDTNYINNENLSLNKQIRRKRDVTAVNISSIIKNTTNNSTGTDKVIGSRNDGDYEDFYGGEDTEVLSSDEDDENSDENSENSDEVLDDNDRNKRQIRHGRYYPKNGYFNGGKLFHNLKPIKFLDIPQEGYNLPFNHNKHNSNQLEPTRKPNFDDTLLSQSNPYFSYQTDEPQSQRPFKASLPDPFKQKYLHHPINSATQIITKSPPISALTNHNNPFTSLSGGFYNNNHNNQIQNDTNPYTSFDNWKHHFQQHDSDQVPSSVVTGKPQHSRPRIEPYPQNTNTHLSSQNGQIVQHSQQENHELIKDKLPENESEEDEESEEEEDDDEEFKPKFPEPPYEFKNHKFKYADVENPFADPNFDFDAYLSKLSSTAYRQVTTPRVKENLRTIEAPYEATTVPPNTNTRSSSLSYIGMSTPRPFSMPTDETINKSPDLTDAVSTTERSIKYDNFQRFQQQIDPQNLKPQFNVPQLKPNQQYSTNQNIAGTPLEAFRPKLNPPNFKDERQLPINFNFKNVLQSTARPGLANYRLENKPFFSSSPKTYYVVTGTGAPQILVSTPKHHYLVKPEKVLGLPQAVTGKPYLISTIKPHNSYITFKQSTPKPLTTVANEHLAALQQFWSKQREISTMRPITELPLQNMFTNAFRQGSNQSTPSKYTSRLNTSTTTEPPKRKPIPKPSPEISDYYYDDDDESYYEPPPNKPKYMPSSEVRPQRPHIAQNYQEYEDSLETDTEAPKRLSQKRPANYNTYKVETATKNHNDVSVVTKSPLKEMLRHISKHPVSIMMSFLTSTPSTMQGIANIDVVQHPMRNRTRIRPNNLYNGPHTLKPPRYLNQTTLRPYTVRHRLAKPTTVKASSTTTSPDLKSTRGRTRHPNIVTQMRVTTPRDSHNQETRYTKVRHDGRTNSLEPTESVTPTYSASPRPKMLYNSSLAYNNEQFDPYYAVYDEDGELYKDSDFVQQYNSASIRPAVQQTYRGTPPPVRKPVEYTARPLADDYDDALIRGQISNQNQYQNAIRQSTRGEGNELGYEHSPVKTTFAATSVSTTPTTLSTPLTTATQRIPVAPYTEAMTPSRYTQRSSTNESPVQNLESTSFPKTSSDTSLFPVSPTFPSIFNISTLAKPFEKTENTHRLKDFLSVSTEKLLTTDISFHNGIKKEDLQRPKPVQIGNENKSVGLTSGFSIRRNVNNTNTPYTITLHSRPLGEYNIPHLHKKHSNTQRNFVSNRYNHNSEQSSRNSSPENSNESMRRQDSSVELISEDHNIPIFVRPTAKVRVVEPRQPIHLETTTSQSQKYILKTVIKRPVPFSLPRENVHSSTENSIDTEALIEKALKNSHYTNKFDKNSIQTTEDSYKNIKSQENSDLRSKNNYYFGDSTTTLKSVSQNTVEAAESVTKSSKAPYYSYRYLDDSPPDLTTEIFGGKAKNFLRNFFTNLITSTQKQKPSVIVSTFKPHPETENTVNIGFQNKYPKYNEEKPLKQNEKRVEILTEPGIVTAFPKYFKYNYYTEEPTTTPETVLLLEPKTTQTMTESTTYKQFVTTNRYYESTEPNKSKFSTFYSNKNYDVQPTEVPHRHVNEEVSQKFFQLITERPTTETNHKFEYDLTKLSKIRNNDTKTEANFNGKITELTTTETTRLTSRPVEQSTKLTKSSPFPTRATRVNSAIKAAANPGSGRRSYQSTSKCATDNSLQANPKCNEIKYQRPTATRGRGSAHYSTLGVSQDSQPPQAPNRGTPPTRSRPTLKPSTAIVSKATEFSDIYSYPPRRPSPVYPQPTPDKTAAKCRKDVCLLPDCYCGGKDIPGDMSVESVPQIVLLTFDDSVNDLNKGLYADLFEKGRVNPNGCPISATFYVSHEWTDYSQVQNLYAAGHEMASHTISHSFGEQFSQKKWNREVGGQREILAAYGGVKLEDVRGMRAPFLSVGGNKMFKMLYDSNFTYDSSMPVYENRPPSWPYTLDYKLFHDCMIPPCPTKSYPGVWEVPMVMWQDLNGGRCSMGDACANPPNAEGVYKMILKNFDRHYTTNRAPFGLYYHAAWFTQPHHKEGFIMFLDAINQMNDVWIITNWQALQWVRDPTPISRLNNFQPFQCNYQDRPKKCNNPKVCNLWHKSGVRYMRTCQPCPEVYPWTGKTGIRSSRIDNEIEE